MAMNISSGRSGGRGRRRGGRRAPMADINVTPFVDVMLVLLIIFMVTAPLLVTGVPVELPESRANTLEQPQEPIEIAIDQSGTTFIDGTQV
ncbi:MAG: protein TolR, partial [Pseudomonadota bacterium]